MTLLVNNAPLTIVSGRSEIGPLSLPAGSRGILVTYANGTWPVVGDGSIVVTLRVSEDGGQSWRDEWSDAFQHVALFRAGVKQTSAAFGITLSRPVGSAAVLRVQFDSLAPDFSTTVSVDVT